MCESIDLLKFPSLSLSLLFSFSFFSATEWNRAGEFRKPLLINPSYFDKWIPRNRVLDVCTKWRFDWNLSSPSLWSIERRTGPYWVLKPWQLLDLLLITPIKRKNTHTDFNVQSANSIISMPAQRLCQRMLCKKWRLIRQSGREDLYWQVRLKMLIGLKKSGKWDLEPSPSRWTCLILWLYITKMKNKTKASCHCYLKF